MASSSAHPPFGGRAYGTSSTTLGKLPDRSAASREAQRLERERAAERERLEREAAVGNNSFAELTEEQREEINEAVSSCCCC